MDLAALQALAPPPTGELDAAEEFQRRVVGGGLLRWLREHGPALLAERQLLAPQLDPEPIVVFVSNRPGLVAADQILGRGHDRVVALSDNDYAEHVDDPELQHHVHTWSWFEPWEGDERARAEHPLADGEIYWLHREGTEWAELAARGAEHLWAWDGADARLLQEAYRSWTR